jgi:hypothetical protein
MTWMPSMSGASIELARPVVAEVNFREMATALAQINRFNGQTPKTISVAQHLIIGCEIASPELRPWWLLHDAHEERVGDVIAPLKEAMRDIAREKYGEQGVEIVEGVRQLLEERHDIVIHQAAGLPLPSRTQQIEIKRIDWIALATERRDFHAAQQRPWWIDFYKVQPHSRVCRPMPPAKAAEQLFGLFSRYLPALSGATGRAA